LKRHHTRDEAKIHAAESPQDGGAGKLPAEEELVPESAEPTPAQEKAAPEKGQQQLQELNDKYLRLYAEFDNYRKRIHKEKEDIRKYGNESILYELLPVVDSLELALKHGTCDPQGGLLQGVEITLKEFQRVLDKFGVKRIEATGRCFDPAVHHAMVQIEREDMDEQMVAEELRAGYLYGDKVLRPSLVSVSVKPKKQTENQETAERSGEEENTGNNQGIEINQKTEEEQ